MLFTFEAVWWRVLRFSCFRTTRKGLDDLRHARNTGVNIPRGQVYEPESGAGAYSRARYGSGTLADQSGKRHKRRGWTKVLGVLCGVLVVVIGALLGYVLWFGSQLDAALAPDKEMRDGLSSVLTPASMNEPFYVLILGSDSREGYYSTQAAEQGDNQRSDVIILARIDTKNKLVTLVSVPRDTPYQLEDGTLVKINEMYNREGAIGSIKAVSKVTGVPISHYAEVGFTGVQAIVDLLGGVDVYVNTDLSYWNPVTNREVSIPAGYQTIDGEQAQIFARARHEYSDFGGTQDSNRQSNVRQLLSAVLKKTLDRPMTDIPGTVLKEAEYVTTDMRSADLLQLATAFGLDSSKMTMLSGTGPSDGDFVEYAGGIWLCYRNPEGWAQLMSVVNAGGDPSGMDFSATSQMW